MPISLYIHTPWCIKKCPYCDFNSHQLNNAIPEDEYASCLIDDLKHDINILGYKPSIYSIFIGGGTPSLMSAKFYNRLFTELATIVNLPNNMEITMEANPGTTEHIAFKDYKSVGINRISLGVQSFSDDKLKSLGRIHSSKETYHAIEDIKGAGIDNFNIDIMHSLPNQTLDEAIFDLEEAIGCEPTHISWYQLTLEPGTNFYHKPPKLPGEKVLYDINTKGHTLLADNGYTRYEISAYSKLNHQCQHNLNYWQFGDYIGIGAGAHGKITLPGKIIRTCKLRQPKHYMDKSRMYNKESITLTTEQLPFEFMLNNLRLIKGFTKDNFEIATGLSFDVVSHIVKEAVQEQLLTEENGCLIPTPLGIKFHNDLLEKFLP